MTNTYPLDGEQNDYLNFILYSGCYYIQSASIYNGKIKITYRRKEDGEEVISEATVRKAVQSAVS